MYNQNYDEYMRSVLGYNIPYGETMYPQDMYQGDYYSQPQMENVRKNEELETYYPDIYKMVHPMVCKICNNAPMNITEEVIENMTNEIYINIEGAESTQETNTVQNRNNQDTKNVKEQDKKETRQQNYLLRDLIRILLIRELLGNKRPPRPGRPPMPPRPPYPRSIYEQRPYYGGEIF